VNSVFSGFEQKAIRYLLASKLAPAAVDAIVREAQLDSIQWHQRGYQLDLSHPSLFSESMQFDAPRVIGQYERFQLVFSAYTDGGRMRLNCDLIDGSEPVPDYLRQRDISIQSED
jgi:hypothetical protein